MRLALTTALSGLALACSDGHATHGDAAGPYNCATEERDDEFVVGLEKLGASGKVKFKLMSANPAPPGRGDNTWTLELTSAPSAAAISGAQMTVTPFMPDHQHGTPISVVVEPMADAGQYKLTPVNLWMPGLWQTTIEVSANGDTDRAVFAFCIAS